MKLSITQKYGNLIFAINNVYVLVRRNVTFAAHPLTQVVVKNGAPFTKLFTMIDGTAIDDVEIIDFVIPMYSLNYFDTRSSFMFCSKDETTNFNVYIDNNNI